MEVFVVDFIYPIGTPMRNCRVGSDRVRNVVAKVQTQIRDGNTLSVLLER